jgi:hypothetical protein
MADESTTSRTVSVPTFSGEAKDFDIFWPRFEAYAEQRGFYDAISVDPVDPELPEEHNKFSSDSEIEKKEKLAVKRNKLAISAFTLAFTTKALMNRVSKSKTSEYPRGLAWKITEGLMKKYRPVDRIAKVEAKAALRKIVMNDNEEPDDFFNKLSAVQQTYADSGLQDEDLITEAMVKVPAQYKSIIAATIQNKGSELTLDDIQEAMNVQYRIEHNRIDDSDEDEENTEKALQASDSSIKCYNCGQPGHKAAGCPKKQNRGRGGRGNSRPGNGKGNGNGYRKFTGTCNNCGKVGHKLHQCWDLEKNKGRRPTGWIVNVGNGSNQRNNNDSNDSNQNGGSSGGNSSNPNSGETGHSSIEYCLSVVDTEATEALTTLNTQSNEDDDEDDAQQNLGRMSPREFLDWRMKLHIELDEMSRRRQVQREREEADKNDLFYTASEGDETDIISDDEEVPAAQKPLRYVKYNPDYEPVKDVKYWDKVDAVVAEHEKYDENRDNVITRNYYRKLRREARAVKLEKERKRCHRAGKVELETGHMAMQGTFKSIEGDEEIWIGDSGATSHLTFSNRGLVNARKAEIGESMIMGNGSNTQAETVGDIIGTVTGTNGEEKGRLLLKEVTHSPQAKFNLMSIPALMKKGWVLSGTKKALILEKNKKKVVFDIIINTPKGMLFCMRIKRNVSEVGTVKIDTTSKVKQKRENINRLHAMMGHVNEDTCRHTAKYLGIDIVRGSLKPCESCGVAKAKKKGVSKDSDHKPSENPNGRVFLDLSKIRAPKKLKHKVQQVHKSNWRLIVDEFSELKFSGFFESKDKMVEPTCELFDRWKQTKKPVKVVRCDNAGENTKLENRLASKDWKMGEIDFEYTARDTPQQNYLVEKGFDTLYNRGRAMMHAANVPEEKRYLLFREAFDTATKVDGLTVVTRKGKEKTRYEHWGNSIPKFALKLKIWGEAGIVTLKTVGTPKVADRGVTCMMAGYATDHDGDCYRMYDDQTKRIHKTRDIKWLGRMYFAPNGKAYTSTKEVTIDKVEETDSESETDTNVDQNNDETTNSGNDNVVRTRSGRVTRPPVRLMDEMVGVFTEAERKYYSTINAQNDFDAKEVAAMAGSNIAEEVVAVGAGLGGGFEHTSELRVMKYEEAMQSNDKAKWNKAVEDEWNNFKEYGVFEAVKKSEVPNDAKFVSTTWAMKKKASGRYKARMNMRGFEQKDGEHYDSMSIAAPVTNDVTIRLCLVLLLMANWGSHVVDIKGAFLHGNFDRGEKIYTEVPIGFERFVDPALYVLLLLKTVYGLKQAAIMFWKELLKGMRYMGYTRSDSDPCLYYKWTTVGLIIWLSWVDDCLCLGDEQQVQKSKEEMKEIFDCDDVGDMTEYVGCKIERDQNEGSLVFTQPVLIQSFQDEFELPTENYETPAEPGKVLGPVIEGQELDSEGQSKYRSIVGKMLHLMRWSRPDIWNSTREASRRMQKANKAHEKQAYRTMKYCVDTKNRGWKLKPTRKWNGRDKEFEFILRGKSDSNYATCTETRRSVTGYAVFLEDAVVAVKSGMQRIVALSVSEAEVIALVMCVQEVLYCKKILESMQLKVSMPIVIEVDNKAAVDLTNGWSSSGATKHMDVRIMFLRELKEDGIIRVIWQPTEANEADIFTKNVDTKTFKRHLQTLCNKD